jgi:hypothetical protein
MLVVVAPHRLGPELTRQPDNPERIRPFGDQISDEDQLISLFPARLTQEIVELLTAAVHVAHDESPGGHDSILVPPFTETKFVPPPTC